MSRAIHSDEGGDWRQRAARAEMTRDVIFLYQTRRALNDPDYAEETGSPIEWGPWRTDSVWLSRAEAEAWGRRNEHNWPAGFWQVYCLCAEGALARLLDVHAGDAK